MRKLLFACASISLFGVISGHAQTTLSGDHIITGNLVVSGTSMLDTVVANQNLEVGGGMVSGFYSLAVGPSSVSGESAAAMGYLSQANGNSSMAFGESSTASGFAAFASGSFVVSHGSMSASFNEGCNAIGNQSFAGGSFTMAVGNASTAMGSGTLAESYVSVAIGANNVGGGDSSGWVETDPIFEIGNGTGEMTDPPNVRNRNAFTVLKNGNVKMTGKIEMPRQGDILMGEFGNPE